MFWSIAKGLAKKVLGRTGQKAAVEGGERAVRSVAREVTQSARGATRAVRREARAVARRPTTARTAEDYFLRPESPRIQTQAVSRNGRDTVARAGEEAARKVDEVAPISKIRQAGRRVAYGPKAGTRATPVDLSVGRRVYQVAKRTGIPLVGIAGSTGLIRMAGGKGETSEGYNFLPAEGINLTSPATDATQQEYADYEQLIREEALARTGQFDPFAPTDSGMGGAGGTDGSGAGTAGGDIYGGVRGGFNDWASNIRGYGTAKGAGIRSTYGELSNEALADAAKAEAIAQAASGDIGRIGTDYAAQATQDIQSPGAGGPTELTGLTPVTGESYDIPGRIADTSQIAADYVLRDLNLTRDDLNFMSGMAKQMGPAYEAQLNENLSLLIADKQFELEQSIFSQQAEDRRASEATRQNAISTYYDRMLALELERGAKQDQSQLTPETIQMYAQSFQGLLDTAQGRQSLAAAGIDLANPQEAFKNYLLMQVKASQQTAGK